MVLQDLSPRRRELAALSLQMDELREEIANLEGELDRLSAACRVPGAPASYPLRISLIAEGLATKRARLGDLSRRARAIEADIAANPSGAYPSLTQPAEQTVIPSAHGFTSPVPVPPAAEQPPAIPVSRATTDLSGEPQETPSAQRTPSSEPQNDLAASIRPEMVMPRAPGVEVTPPAPEREPSRVRRGLAWGFVAAAVLVLGLLIAGLLADVRRSSPSPPPASSGMAPTVLEEPLAGRIDLSLTY